MDWRSFSKAIAGAVVAGATSTGTAAVTIPDGVGMPWYGYIIVGVINAAIGFGVVYFAPKNTTVK